VGDLGVTEGFPYHNGVIVFLLHLPLYSPQRSTPYTLTVNFFASVCVPRARERHWERRSKARKKTSFRSQGRQKAVDRKGTFPSHHPSTTAYPKTGIIDLFLSIVSSRAKIEVSGNTNPKLQNSKTTTRNQHHHDDSWIVGTSLSGLVVDDDESITTMPWILLARRQSTILCERRCVSKKTSSLIMPTSWPESLADYDSYSIPDALVMSCFFLSFYKVSNSRSTK